MISDVGTPTKAKRTIVAGVAVAFLAGFAWWWAAGLRAEEETYVPAGLLAGAAIILLGLAAIQSEGARRSTRAWAYLWLMLVTMVVGLFAWAPQLCDDTGPRDCRSYVGLWTPSYWPLWVLGFVIGVGGITWVLAAGAAQSSTD